MFTKFNTQTISPAASGRLGRQAELHECRNDSRTGARSKGPLRRISIERFVYQDDEIIEKPFNWKEFETFVRHMKPYAKQLLPLIILDDDFGYHYEIVRSFLDQFGD